MKKRLFFAIILIGLSLFLSLSYAYAQEPMIGEVRMWAGASPGSQPFSGWFVADGRAVSRTTYADLFAVIGTTYGVGDGSTTFNLPDFTDNFPQGANSSPGGTGGEASHTLTVNEMPSHQHEPDWPYRFMVESNSSGNAGDRYDGGTGFFFDYTGYTSSVGGGQAHNNLPPYLDIYFIIFAGPNPTPTPTPTNTATPTNTPTPTDTATPTPTPTSTPSTVEVRVTTSSDDAEETSTTGAVSVISSDLELVEDGGIAQTVGLRFQNVTLPDDVTITNAYIEFETDTTGSVATSLTIYGHDADNPGTFANCGSCYGISTLTQTTASVAWNNIPAWDVVDEKHQTPNLASIVQEILARPGWSSGNSMVFTLDGSGKRVAESYDGEAPAAPLLHIEYLLPTPTPTPTSTPTNTPTPTATATSDAICGDGTASTLQNSLVSHWKLNEASGTRYDAHNGFDLTDNNTVGQDAGVIGNAADFAASNSEYLSLDHDAVFSPGTSQFTIAAWVHPTGLAFDEGIAGKINLSSSIYEYAVTYDSHDQKFIFSLYDSGGTPHSVNTGVSSAAPGNWYFLVVWFDDNYIYIQLDDNAPNQIANTIVAFDTPGAKLVLGAIGLSGGSPVTGYNGQIDSVSFWGRNLTSDEISTLYNNGIGFDYPFCIPAYTVYTYTLTSNQVLAVPVHVTFGEILISGSLLLLSLVFIIKMMFRKSWSTRTP